MKATAVHDKLFFFFQNKRKKSSVKILVMVFLENGPYYYLCEILFALQSKKPLMEKMRRARINDSLNELKSLVLEAMKKDVSVYNI